MPIRILIADDYSMIRRGLRVILSADPAFEVLAEATDGLQAVRLAQELKPDVVLMDVRMPTMNGLAATAAILRACPEMRVVILASAIDEASVLEAVRVGAAGFLLKETPDDELCHAVRRAAAGEVQLAPQATAFLVRQVRAPERVEPLSDREKDVLRLLVQGQTNKEIAQALCVGDKTVKTHVSNILAKLGCQTRTQAATMATRMGLVSDT